MPRLLCCVRVGRDVMDVCCGSAGRSGRSNREDRGVCVLVWRVEPCSACLGVSWLTVPSTVPCAQGQESAVKALEDAFAANLKVCPRAAGRRVDLPTEGVVWA